MVVNEKGGPTVSFVYWVYEDKDCFVFPHNSGYVGVSEDPKRRWYSLRTAKTVPKTAKLLILSEGLRDQCLARERLLRPHKNIGWNKAVGGVASARLVHGYCPIKSNGPRPPREWRWKD